MTDLAVIEELKLSNFETKKDWETYLSRLSVLNNGVQFMIGDAILAGEESGYVESGVYDEVEELTGISRGTLKNYVSVSKKISIKNRKPGLGFEAHKITAALPPVERELILDEAEEKQLSNNEIKALTKSERQEEPEPITEKSISDFDAEDTAFIEVPGEPVTHTIQDFGDTPLDVTDNAANGETTAKYILTVAEEFEYNGQYLNEYVNWLKEYVNENF